MVQLSRIQLLSDGLPACYPRQGFPVKPLKRGNERTTSYLVVPLHIRVMPPVLSSDDSRGYNHLSARTREMQIQRVYGRPTVPTLGEVFT
jgi:hypothetical protein